MATQYLRDETRLTLVDKFVRIPWLLVVVVSVIAAVGAAALYSSAGGNFSPWADRHILRFMIGLGLFLVLSVVPARFWLALAYPFYALSFALLALVPVIGHIGLGARRWIEIGGFAFQPSELMKVAAILALARFFHMLPAERRQDFRTLLAAGLMVALPALLIIRQPDLGTAVMLLVIGAGVIYAAGVPARYFIGGALLAGTIAPFLWTLLHDYQRQRIETFLAPEADPLGAGYHIIQSKIALAAGGMTGKGFMLGTQSKLGFLPEKHTDFILAMLAEEIGFIGVALLLALFGVLLVVLLHLALRNG